MKKRNTSKDNTILTKMKCLECDYEKEETTLLKESLEETKMLCPRCGKKEFVPIDMYEKIKSKYIYKTEK